jgi:hypothetical protein
MMEEEISRKADAKPALAVHKPKSLFLASGPNAAAVAASSASSISGINLGPEFASWSA